MPIASAPIDSFERSTFEHGGVTRTVFRQGTGPGVIVIHELPGITPQVAGFGARVAASGFTAVLPHLFGEPGRPMSNGYVAREFVRGCVSREFTVFATGRASPVTGWLRALAASVHRECGGPGVGVVGMCFTGGFALAMAVDDVVVAPVLSQPSLPLGLRRSARRDVGLSAGDEATVAGRAAGGLCTLGLRFTEDRAVPPERFAHLRALLGDRFLAVEIDSSSGNPHGIRKGAHSVLTLDLVDEPGHPTRDALEQVIRFLRERLDPAPTGSEPGSL